MRYSSDMGGLAWNFVHKRLLAAAGGLLTGGPLAAARGFVTEGRRSNVVPTPRLPARLTVSRTATARPSVAGALEQEAGRGAKFTGGGNGGGRCILPFRPDPSTGRCRLFLGDRPGPDDDPVTAHPMVTGGPPGEAVMGRFGVAMVPGNRVVNRAVCLRGMKLGNDGLCYDKIRNSDRMWPKGRRPLLTGGEMRAISIASGAARRLTRTAVRLQEIGLIKKPVAKKPPKKKYN